MISETGKVIDAFDGIVMVKIVRKSACGGNCAECGACGSSENIIEAVNKINAQKGDFVELQMQSGRVLAAAFLVYILPLILMAAGYFISGIYTDSEAVCALVGLAVMILGFVILHNYDKKSHEKYKPTAVSLIKKHDFC